MHQISFGGRALGSLCILRDPLAVAGEEMGTNEGRERDGIERRGGRGGRRGTERNGKLCTHRNFQK